MTFRFKDRLFKIEIKAKGLKGLDIYYSNDGQETLLRQVAGLAVYRKFNISNDAVIRIRYPKVLMSEIYN